jgi:hypothetical protein
MGKPHPLELRERVVAFVEEENTHRSTAAHFRVSIKFVNDMVILKRETCALAPKPQGRGDAQSHVDGLVFDLTAFRIANFDPKRIEKNNRIHRFQGAVLPVCNLLQNGISDTADKIS